MNKLYYGDNLTIMQKMDHDSIDLIYLDPPFNSNRSYNFLYKNTTGLPVPEQVEAFCDAWDLDYEKAELARNMPIIMQEYGIHADVVEFWKYWIRALKSTNPKMLAYLVYMTIRLIEMHRLLKPSGTIYLHCDPTASHYLKVMMDGIFGHDNFINEIIWCYSIGGRGKRSFGKKHDAILLYAKGKQYTFNSKAIGIPMTAHKQDSYHLDEGKTPEDWWIDINAIQPSAKERLGYPTQKPVALLDRIIKASCPDEGIVFDPFCGCGTTIESAIENNRKWIGIDIAIHSIHLIENRRIKKYQDIEYEIDGIPQSDEQAQYLFEQDPFQFQRWAVEKTGGFCSDKMVTDRGIDGKLYFEADNQLYNMVLSVKGGTIRPTEVRDLHGVLESDDDTKLAGFISLHEPTKAMREAADAAGYYEYKGTKYSRIQLMTIKEVFEGKSWHCPSVVKIKEKEAGQMCFAI